LSDGEALPMRRASLFCAALGLALGACWFPAEARAQSTIKQPGQRPHYAFEAEPHLLLGPFDPPGRPRGEGLGVGFRGTIELVRNGFVKTINNSVGISFGFDWVRYPNADPRGICTESVSGPNGTSICVEVDGGRASRDFFYLPVAMQWNFWLARRWSVFAEPGLLPYLRGGELHFTPIALYAGGRFHFSDQVALTMRLGYPTLSLGVSFFL
jgi:hypothetical protein